MKPRMWLPMGRRGLHQSPRARWDRSLALTSFIGVLLLSVLGLVFSVAQGSRRITTDAAALHTADEALRSATVSRAQLALAVHMAVVDLELGTNSSDAVALSIEEAELALTDLEAGTDLLYENEEVPDEVLRDEALELDTTGRSIIALLEENDPVGAQALATSRLGSAFDALTEDLVGRRDELASRVDASDHFLGRVGNIARFLVAFLIPTTVVIIYRGLLRRQQRQAELEARLQNERALNAAREAFVANASHELRTPLTSIVGMSMLLSERETIQADAAAADILDIIIGESDDLARMVEDLLTTARLDAGALSYAFEDLDIQAEINQTAETMSRSGMDLTAQCVPAHIRTDRMRLRQLLRNLLSNARKYGGPHVRIEGRIDGSTYVCSVVDDGPGIPDEIAPRLFERFIHQGHQTATKDSVGLGLSIVHALAQGMGGSISYERVRGESYFSLRLPLAKEAFPPGTAPPQTEELETSDESGVPEEALHTGSEPA